MRSHLQIVAKRLQIYPEWWPPPQFLSLGSHLLEFETFTSQGQVSRSASWELATPMAHGVCPARHSSKAAVLSCHEPDLACSAMPSTVASLPGCQICGSVGSPRLGVLNPLPNPTEQGWPGRCRLQGQISVWGSGQGQHQAPRAQFWH